MSGPIDIGDLRRQHSKLLAKTASGIDNAAREIAQRSANVAQNTNALKVRTGRGRAGWLWKTYRLQNGAGGSLENRVPYMAYQERGTGLWGPRHAKYPIVARRAKALRFIGRDGSVVFRRRVMHPGVQTKLIGLAAMFGRQAPFFGEDHSLNMRIIERHLAPLGREPAFAMAAQ